MRDTDEMICPWAVINGRGGYLYNVVLNLLNA